ncbi:OLC1v1012242C1 [Oldenlandia corymbosa var. corymbosa]|uniref:OLC1v1012242C1 n=1 Tax=Oldenlandia corymbosa var. corymbosa TaxID=529605 RepID=A0AAV1DW63_OLDCO|nr:OLC1v1012242C1 [Oldenlandia corymbosa var. corymbosa]
MATKAPAAPGAAGTASGKKNKKKGRPPSNGNNNVAEATKIKISQILEQFRASSDLVYTFEPNLNNYERAAVHVLCRKMGMKSKSSGNGGQRRVSVYKTKKKADSMNGQENLTSFTFSVEAGDVLCDMFMHYPPGDNEISQYMVEEQHEKSHRLRGKKDDMFSKPFFNKSDIEKKIEGYNSRVEKSPNLKQITEGRAKLPIASFAEAIKSTVASNQVVLISGETGCGKTTQVPQFLLDHMWGKGENCKIVCTQPRRISAISVAERISAERDESVGDTIGYKIRLESKGGRNSSVVFCTNGVLLRVLVSRGSDRTSKSPTRKAARDVASDITHIIVDEIHERDRYSDFMLAILRDMLPLYPNLRLVLMSATIDADRFSNYFGGCPIIRVPGFTYPVKIFFLEDVLTIVKSNEDKNLKFPLESNETEESMLTEEYKVALDEALTLALTADDLDSLRDLISSEGGQKFLNYQHSSTGMTPLMVFSLKGSIGDICMLLSLGADCHLRANDGTTALDCAEKGNQGEAVEILRKHSNETSCGSLEEQLLEKYLSNFNPELIDDALIEKLLKRICIDSKDGAILIFLPGWDDINRTRERLNSSPYFRDPSKFVIISLHSMVPSVEQKKVFKRPPLGCRKIILSTNIAETAVTIDDIVYVIDTGRMKEKSYDPYNNVSTLQSSWISKASAKQREGRAGRCQPGICYHLYSKLRAASLPDFQVPEIKRMPIEELCLQVKLIDPNCKIEDFLRKTLDPPVYETIYNAIIVLQDIGALTLDEKLTTLGTKIGALPVHPLTSKMLLIAILLNCLDPALTLACASDYRDPFTLPMLPNDRKRASAAKSELASLYGGSSDQLAVVAAYEGWKCAKEKGQEARFCSEYFISATAMRMISGMRKQLLSELLRNGFLTGDESSFSLNAHDSGILHTVLVAGLYPMIGRFLPPIKGGKRSFIETAGGDKVRLHPHSTNSRLSYGKCHDKPIIAYDEITRGDGGLHIRNCSIIGPLPLLLLATEIVVAPTNEDEDEDNEEGSEYEGSDDDFDENKAGNNVESNAQKIMSSPDNKLKVIVDRWLAFESKALDVAQIYCLRERLSAAILYKVTNPGKVLPEMLVASIYAIVRILSYDGMSGIPLPSESVDMLASMVDSTAIGPSTNGRGKGIGHNPRSFLRSLIFPVKNKMPAFFEAQVLRSSNASSSQNQRPAVSSVGMMNVQPRVPGQGLRDHHSKRQRRQRGNEP